MTASRSRRPGTGRDAYQAVTDRIVAALERGTVPWRTPWGGGHRNALSGRPYRGVNLLVLSAAASERGFAHPRWLTYRQAERLGGHVRRGEQGTQVVLWKWVERRASGDDESPERYPLLRLFTLFNVAQCDELRLAASEVSATPPPLERAEAIVCGYHGGPQISFDADGAYYQPLDDEVHLPPRSSFPDSHGFYATLLHELAHSTGHPSRLNRESYQQAAPFGSERYSREELVAEFAAAFLGAQAEIDPSRLEQSAAYISSWLEALRDDRRLVVVAAGQAQRAADHILGFDPLAADAPGPVSAEAA